MSLIYIRYATFFQFSRQGNFDLIKGSIHSRLYQILWFHHFYRCISGSRICSSFSSEISLLLYLISFLNTSLYICSTLTTEKEACFEYVCSNLEILIKKIPFEIDNGRFVFSSIIFPKYLFPRRCVPVFLLSIYKTYSACILPLITVYRRVLAVKILLISLYWNHWSFELGFFFFFFFC